MTTHPALALLARALNPDDLGHAVSTEFRALARSVVHNAAAPQARWLYIAGPMTGHPDDNRPAFHAAHAELQRAGFVCMNPALNGLPHTAPWHHQMRRDYSMLIACSGVALLPGWETSRGVRDELIVATNLQMQTGRVEDWLREEVTA